MEKTKIEVERARMTDVIISLISRIKNNGINSDFIIVDVENKSMFSIFLSEFLRRGKIDFEKNNDIFQVGMLQIILYNNDDVKFPDVCGLVFFV